jgi:uncharacterized protein (TIGR00725 family)
VTNTMHERPDVRRRIVGVIGGGEATGEDLDTAYELGRLIAQNDWVLLNGGGESGVSDASAKGAHEAGGLTIGILSYDHRRKASPYIQIAIVTGMGSARNNISVLSSDVIIACSGAAGTLSEIGLALKAGRRIIALDTRLSSIASELLGCGSLVIANSPQEAIDRAREVLEVTS